MRIELKNGVVVCVCEDWENLLPNERKFLSDCYWRGCWADFDVENNLVMRSCESALDAYQTLCNIFLNAKNNMIEVSDEVKAHEETLSTAARAETAKRQKMQAVEWARERWASRQRNGCDGCEHCETLGDGWFRCNYSGEELNSKMGSFWNAARGIYELFHESGMPNEHCKDYYKEEIRKTEDMKNAKI